MRTEVMQAVEELKRQFSDGSVAAAEDGQGGAYVIVDGVSLGSRFRPEKTWIGAQITAQYPYADIYPVFVGADVVRADGVPFASPISPSAHFQGRAALQISRKNNAIGSGPQTAVAKFLKILDFLERLP